MAAASPIWHQPSADFEPDRARIDPPPLPNPNPSKKTARMIENVYVVAPIITDSRRVQITSAPNAHRPESAIVMYTSQGRSTGAVDFSTATGEGWKAVRFARAKLAAATAKLITAPT